MGPNICRLRRLKVRMALLKKLCLAIVAVFGAGLFCRPVHGQGAESGRVPFEGKFWQYAEPHPAPYQNQIKFLMKGVRARPIPGTKRVTVTQAEAQTFHTDGRGELIVQAPECTFDEVQHSVNSPGPLKVQTADGRFIIEGEGFLFVQTNSMLFISNRVHTTLFTNALPGHMTGINSNSIDPRATEIFSRQFDYAIDSGKGTYRDDVQVLSTNLNLSSGILEVNLTTNRELSSIVATQDVHIIYQGVQAAGRAANYSEQSGLARLTGDPSWQAGGHEGSGEELIIDRTNGVFRVNGQGKVRLLGQSMGPSGFLPTHASTSSNLPAGTNRYVEIASDSYEFRTNNSAIFDNHVRVTENVNGDLHSTMTCRFMQATFFNTNELQRMVAEGRGERVLIEQGDQGFTAGTAIYTATNGLLELIEHPTWRAGLREGKGDLIIVNVPLNEMNVRTNASARLPAKELGQTQTLNYAGAKTAATSDTNEMAQVNCEEYTIGSTNSLFQGEVHLAHPRMNMTCGQISVEVPLNEKRPRRMVAEPEVVFAATLENGQIVHGTGDKAVYTYSTLASQTNELLTLFGKPAMLEATNWTFRNNVVLLDYTKNDISAAGRYRMTGIEPLKNNLKLPKTKFRK